MGTMPTQMSFPRLVVRAGKSVCCVRLSFLSWEIWSLTEKLHEDVVVNDLDTDVAIKGSGN